MLRLQALWELDFQSIVRQVHTTTQVSTNIINYIRDKYIIWIYLQLCLSNFIWHTMPCMGANLEANIIGDDA